jgi:hypothetical protein
MVLRLPSSDFAYDSLLKRISRALSSEGRHAFSQAIMVLGTQRIPNETFDESSQRFLRRIHGKTVRKLSPKRMTLNKRLT